ncbi:MAG: hypothetical protein GY762_20230 [Proteobacteria bacterium]|nr:hypothetical protein [Pseudomonadota bacterium]
MRFALTLGLLCLILTARPALSANSGNEPAPAAVQSQSSEPVSDDEDVVDVFDVGEQTLKKLVAEEPEPVSAEPLPKNEKTPPLRIGGAVTMGLGAAALIAGAVTGGLAISLDNNLDSAKCPDGQCFEEYSNDVDKRDNLALATNVLLISGGSVLVAGVLMVVFSFPEFRRSERSSPTESLTVRPIIGRSFVGTSVTWSF